MRAGLRQLGAQRHVLGAEESGIGDGPLADALDAREEGAKMVQPRRGGARAKERPAEANSWGCERPGRRRPTLSPSRAGEL